MITNLTLTLKYAIRGPLGLYSIIDHRLIRSSFRDLTAT